MTADDPKVADDLSVESRLSQIVDEILEKRAANEAPRLEDYEAKYPELAEVIRDLLPMLSVLQDRSVDGHAPSSIPDLSVADRRLGDFRLVRELGRGGMGIVYEAEEISLGRRVALKVLPFAALLDHRQLERFKNEARAAALLKHPHIVTIYSVGTDRGIHYFAMEYVDGVNLTHTMAAARDRDPIDGRQLEPASTAGTPDTIVLAHDSTWTSGRLRLARWRALARLGIQAAAALEHAHLQGVIHRDIKPSNLLIDRKGNLFVSDFGLARIQADVGITGTGDVLGTLRYMSPEQLRGDRSIDHRADIYSLGLTLYELAVDRPAFESSSRERLIHDIMYVNPPMPRRIRPDIPRDLETIVLKAIAKDPVERYRTALDLQQDLERFVDGRHVLARRASPWTRLVGWVRRQPGVASLLFLTLGLLGLLAVGGPLVAWRQGKLTAAAERNLLLADLNLAYHDWYNGNAASASRLLGRHATDGESHTGLRFARNYLRTQIELSEQRVLFRDRQPINTVSVSPDGRTVACGGESGIIHLVDLPSRKLVRELTAGPQVIQSLAFTPDGSQLVAGGEQPPLMFWSLPNGEGRLPEELPPAEVRSLSCSPDGQLIALGMQTGELGLWSVHGRRVWVTAAHAGALRTASFTPDGQSIVTACEGDPHVQLWDAATGNRPRRVASLKHLTFGATLSARDRVLITHSPLGVQVWDLQSGRELPGLAESTLPIASVAVSSDGFLATGGYDNQVMIWDFDSRWPLARFRGHHRSVASLTFTPDGQRLISSGEDGTVHQFDLGELRLRRAQLSRFDFNREAKVAVSADGRTMLSLSANWEMPSFRREPGRLAAWDPSTGVVRHVVTIDDDLGAALAIDARGAIGATAGPAGVCLWDAQSLSPIKQLDTIPTYSIAFSPDGQWLAALGCNRAGAENEAAAQLRIWKLPVEGSPVVQVKVANESLAVGAVDFTDTSTSLVFVSRQGAATQLGHWQFDGQQWRETQRRPLVTHAMRTSVCCLRDGRELIVASTSGIVERVGLADLGVRWSAVPTSRHIFAAAVSSDGQLVATGSDREIHLTDGLTGDLLVRIEVPMWVCSLAFTPDDRTLIWGGGDGSVNFERTVVPPR